MRLDGGLIDRAQPLRFRFNGRAMTGYAGDTLASALMANGVRLVARSFKYHRPRGVFSAGSEEPNALVTLGTGAQATPNTRATMVELTDGMAAFSQNHLGPLSFDLLAVNDALSPLLGAGFYYKTFMWPRAFWEKLYEPAIRRAAGLGKLPGAPDPGVYERGFLHCDLLVVGAGAAGQGRGVSCARNRRQQSPRPGPGTSGLRVQPGSGPGRPARARRRVPGFAGRSRGPAGPWHSCRWQGFGHLPRR